ncbi:MAG: polymorphic toxin type 44 domain-containing protein [Eubacteriales bacterium]|nr:polymorphic toxin type 44 domain-containing protein [Eubacteriales bacterium]
MRTIVNRIGKDMKGLNFAQDEEKPLNFKKATKTTLQKTTLQEMLALRTDKVISKSANAGDSNRIRSNNILISDITGNRGLVSQGKKLGNDNDTNSRPPKKKDPYIPISVVTGSRDITTVSPELRAYLLKGSPSATNAIPGEYADVANVLNKAGDTINFDNWADLTAKQQLAVVQRAGLSNQDKRTLLNTSSHYVETIAKIQAVFANRYQLGISLADARNVAKELFDIANEKDEAYTRTGKYEQDAVFAPKALRWLKEKEDKILDNLTKNAGETEWDTEYTGGNPDLAARAARRASYADIDQAAASEQIEELIMNNVAEAKKVAFISGANKLISEPTLLWSFYQNIKKDAPMDYKNPVIWSKVLPGLPYPEEDQVYNVFGVDISSSDLGNLNYALVGKTLGITEALLLQQAGAAQLRDHGGKDLYHSEIESLNKRDEDFGDQPDDQKTIKNGFDIFDLIF